jgi:hypothetical protein
MNAGILTSILTGWLLIGNAAADPTHYDRCNEECVAFDNGYEWALASSISSEFECDGRGPAAFIAGCAAYIKDSLQDQRRSVDPNEDDDTGEEDHARHY